MTVVDVVDVALFGEEQEVGGARKISAFGRKIFCLRT